MEVNTPNHPEHEELLSDDELHARALHFINESNQLLFDALPKVISQIIQKEIWKTRINPYSNFGEYALDQSSEGLGIANNDMLWLLKSAIKKKTQHPAHWASVLGEVDTNVRAYAKEKKIPVSDFSRDLTEYEQVNHDNIDVNRITYLPSRSSSNDGQLMKLKKKDPEAYDKVLQGRLDLKEAVPVLPKKRIEPIEQLKNKFSGLSKSDKELFLLWLEGVKEEQEA